LDCQSCSEEQKKDRGCIEDSPIPNRWEISGMFFNRCPLSIITEQSLEYLEAYKLFRMGILPYQRGWLHQSHKFVEAIKVIDQEILKLKDSETRSK